MSVERPDLRAIKERLAAAPVGPLAQDPAGNRLLIDLRHVIAYVEELERDPTGLIRPESVEL